MYVVPKIGIKACFLFESKRKRRQTLAKLIWIIFCLLFVIPNYKNPKVTVVIRYEMRISVHSPNCPLLIVFPHVFPFIIWTLLLFNNICWIQRNMRLQTIFNCILGFVTIWKRILDIINTRCTYMKTSSHSDMPFSMCMHF